MVEVKDLLGYLGYLFNDIDWEYDFLTDLEKEVLPKDTFKKLKQMYFND